MKTSRNQTVTGGILALSLVLAPLMAEAGRPDRRRDHDRRPAPAPVERRSAECRQPVRHDRSDRIGAAIAGFVIGSLLIHSTEATPCETRTVYVAPPPPPPPPRVVVVSAPPPVLRPIVVELSAGRRLYQPPIAGHPALLQVWDGFTWQTLGERACLYE